jgi:hypothetical protein
MEIANAIREGEPSIQVIDGKQKAVIYFTEVNGEAVTGQSGLL